MSKKSRYSIQIRNKGRLITCVVILLLLVGSILLINSSLFNVKNIYIHGGSNISRKEVIKLSGLKEGDNIFSVKKSTLEKELINIVNVKNVQVVKQYPDIVKIILSERIPYLIFENKGKYYSVDNTDKLIAISAKLDNDAGVVITGEAGTVFETLKVGKAVKPPQTNKIKTIYDTLNFFTSQSLINDISELHISKDGGYYIYTKKSNVIYFYSLNDFLANTDFIRDFVISEDRHIMVEVIEDVKPVYKEIKVR